MTNADDPFERAARREHVNAAINDSIRDATRMRAGLGLNGGGAARCTGIAAAWAVLVGLHAYLGTSTAGRSD